MYFPILRGKQFELSAIRELAELTSGFSPVIEPVRANSVSLVKTIKTLGENKIIPYVIINPSIGDFEEKSPKILQDLDGNKDSSGLFIPCVKIRDASDASAISLFESLSGRDAAVFVEDGIDKKLIAAIDGSVCTFVRHNLPDGALSRLKNIVLYGDFFNKQERNADYGSKSVFSSLHIKYRKYENAIGFGDFTILSEDYSESGGPAYVVTIHLSYIDEDEFDSMYVRHFSSFDDASPANPGGKFKDALRKLVRFSEKNPELLYDTEGLKEFLELHKQGHFPGLGQVKKVSMKHHIETTCIYLGEQSNG